MSPTTFFLLLLSCSVYCLSSTAHTRRILHQPFQSLRSDPPVSAPPASPVYGDAPFFPSNRLLPPPSPLSPKALASFPANISSIIVPRAQESNPVSSKLIGTAIASASATVIVIMIGVVLLFRKKMNRSVSGEWKSHRSDSSARLSYCNSIGGGRNPLVPKLQRPCQPSSELLYLGTVANLHGASAPRNLQTTPSSISTRNVRPLKPGSQELRSLAPLHRQSFELHYEIGSEADEETDVFYSPKGSLGDRESSVGTGSASRRAFSAVEVEIFEQSSSSSSSSPKMPACLRIPPPESCSRLRSPESLPIQTALSPLQSPPQHPPPVFVAHWTYTRESDSPSPASSSSPERDSRRSIDSSPGTSCTWDRSIKSPLRICNSVESPPQLDSHFRLDIQGIESPERISFSRTESHARTSTSLPQSGHSLPISAAPSPFPPGPSFCTPALTRPPPPPSIKMWESPHTPSMDESPELVNSFRQIKIESPTLSSPVQSPLKPESGESNAQMVGLCSTESSEKNEDKTKPMLKPLHWDKVLASSHGEIVCDHLQSNSFKVDEGMMKTLFVTSDPNSKSNLKETDQCQRLPSLSQENSVFDRKKSQSIFILLKALNVTIEDICKALLEGKLDALGTELLETLMKMVPSKEEERKLKEYKDNSPFKLGPAEKFLKALLDIPFAFKRIQAMLYISNFDSEINHLKRSFEILELACEDLRSSRMFLKLLEAVLKTGNRMTGGTACRDVHVFKLDTLLKLVDVMGADGKTSLLHFVVQELIGSEGTRVSTSNQHEKMSFSDDTMFHQKIGLQAVSRLSSELKNVKKAANMDSDVLHGDVLKLSKGFDDIVEFLLLDKSSCAPKFSESLSMFAKMAEEEIIRIRAQESVAISLVKEIIEYFHGKSTREEAHPFRIFMVVRDFLVILDRVCNEVGMINERTMVSSGHKFPVPVNPMLHPGAGFSQRMQFGSSDDSS